MINTQIPAIYHSLQEIAWHFGNHGINGECCGDLSLVEFMALKKVYENKDYSIQEIGNALNFTKSGATRIIDRLESKGYVNRQRSPIDGRVCCVHLTAKGTEVVAKIIEKYIVYLQEELKDLDASTVDKINDVLEILQKAVGRHKLMS